MGWPFYWLHGVIIPKNKGDPIIKGRSLLFINFILLF